MKKKPDKISKLIMTLGGVDVIAQVDGKDEIEIARLETVSAMIRNAFQPKREKGEEDE